MEANANCTYQEDYYYSLPCTSTIIMPMNRNIFPCCMLHRKIARHKQSYSIRITHHQGLQLVVQGISWSGAAASSPGFRAHWGLGGYSNVSCCIPINHLKMVGKYENSCVSIYTQFLQIGKTGKKGHTIRIPTIRHCGYQWQFKKPFEQSNSTMLGQTASQGIISDLVYWNLWCTRNVREYSSPEKRKR